MKSYILFFLIATLAIQTNAQVGIGTVSPNSTLDVRGSFSPGYRSFTASTSASSTDHTLAFTGTSACSVTLPDATGCAARIYIIKNASTTGPTPIVTINTTSSQTIDGITTYLLDQSYKSVTLVSNGTNWHVASQTSSTSAWNLGGNNITSIQNFGTTSNYDLPFITNNVENMRLSATGNLGVGTSVFNVTNPEKLVVNAGTTSSVNAIVGKGSINNYLQLNIQNNNAGTNASSDVVATADNGNETTNYVDMGINSSVNTAGVMGGINDAYLYTTGNNFLLGTANAAKSLVFMTGGTTQSTNERMRIDGSGNVGVATNAPTAKLDVSGTYKLGTAGTVLTNMIKTSFTINDATNFDYTATRQITVTVTGATVNATLIINPRTALATGLGIGWARVSSTNNVTIGFTNTDATARSVGNITFDITVIQ